MVKVLGVSALIAMPLWSVIGVISSVSFRDHLDVFSSMMGSAGSLVFPLAVVITTCFGVYTSVAVRHIANTRFRISVRTMVARQLRTACVSAAAIFFLYAFVPFVVSFYLWPLFGDPAVDADGYGLTPASAVIDSFGRITYSFLLEPGEWVYGLLYSGWVALAAATYAALGVCFLLTVPNRILALALPFIIYMGQSIAAALAGRAHLQLSSSVFPQGLVAADPLVAASPTLALMLLSIGFAAWVIAHAPTNKRLS